MEIHPLITKTQEVEALCKRFADADFVAVDTEFMRENSYWPDLCLLQICDGKEAAAIDPKADGIDLSCLLDLLVNNENVLKIFHAGGQDVEIIYNMTGKTPHPIFDTQIAAMAIGQSEQIGYSNLVGAWLSINIDKGARFTDWSRRPLNDRQLEYAIADVTHLAEIFPMILKKLKDTGRGSWINTEMEKLANPANYRIEPDKCWQRVKFSSRKPDVLGRLKALAAWREHEAQDKNLPRGRIMRDETLADIASHPPKSQDKLGQVRGLSAGWKNNDIGARMMKALANAKPLSQDELPSRGGRKARLTKDTALVADLIKLLLKIRCAEIEVASRLITRADEIERLVAGERDGLPLLEGWRYEQFGRDALDLIEGRMSFSVKNGELNLHHQPEDG